MDNLTHTLTGVALSRMGLDRRVSGATLTLALSSNLPDLDVASAFWGNVSYLEHHRGISHAFPLSPVLAMALAVVLAAWPRSTRRFLPTFLLAWLGVSLHIVWDLWTSYGTRALLPFDSTWYAWDWMFIVDPILLALLAAASFSRRSAPSQSPPRLAAALALGYLLIRAVAHTQALAQAESLAGPEFTVVRALPDPVWLNRWRLLASSREAFVTGYVPAIGASRSRVAFPRTPSDAMIESVALESRAARVFLDFSAFPRLQTRKENDLTVIVWRDLRFADRRANGFFCEVKVDSALNIVSERIVF